MKRILLTVLFCWMMTAFASAQNIAVKANMLYAATATPNLSVEAALGKQYTLNVTGGYNPWGFSGDQSFEHWAVQPEARYWLFNKFYGHYLGVYAQYANYNIRYPGFLISSMKDKRYDGNAVGGGISYGYQLYLSSCWNLEFSLGIGYLRMEYDKYYRAAPAEEQEHQGRFLTDYFGPTNAGISIVYIIK